ncbi:MAG: hypothetical protein AB7R89_08920 [Dehalococcoidia bacterium]
MTTAREHVRDALDRLSDEEAREVLALVQEIERRRDNSAILERLAADRTFRVPIAGHTTFRRIEPIDAAGRAASELLVEDRR